MIGLESIGLTLLILITRLYVDHLHAYNNTLILSTCLVCVKKRVVSLFSSFIKLCIKCRYVVKPSLILEFVTPIFIGCLLNFDCS